MFISARVQEYVNSFQARAWKAVGRKSVTKAERISSLVYDAARKHYEQLTQHQTQRSQYQIRCGKSYRAAFLADAEMGYPYTCFGFAMPHPLAKPLDIVAVSKLEPGYSGHVAKAGRWWIGSREKVNWDNDYYSKAWHRAHGGKRIVEARTVLIRRYGESKKKVIKKDVELDSWRGLWWLKALEQAGIVKKKKVASRLKAVQLNPLFGVRRVRRLGDMEMYERTLAGSHYDYCALWHGLTFHADTQRNAVRGLREKMRDAERKEHAPIDFKFCRSLGFCESGIEQFCHDFGLDVSGRYTAEEIAQAVRGDYERAAVYGQELSKLAEVTGYQISA